MTLNDQIDALLGQLESPERHWSSGDTDPHAAVLSWHMALLSLLRRGQYEKGPTPAKLLAAANQAAMHGAVPLALPGELRHQLTLMAAELKTSGAWTADRPLPWQPLPPPGQAECLLAALAAAIAWPQHATSPVQIIPDFLAVPTLEMLATALEQARESGHLQLEAEGVGKDGHLSESRNDSVAYLSGLEPPLLEHLPELAALIQYLLAELPRRLGDQGTHPPLRVMLARYQPPNNGYKAHVDNPGGDDDNGRRLSFTLYLNSRERPCQGGELAFLTPDRLAPRLIPASGGLAALFDAREVTHQVCRLAPGPARWALVFWLHATPKRPPTPPLPRLEPLQLLLAPVPVALPDGTVLLQRCDGATVEPRLLRPETRAKVALVATVYRGHAFLQAFCAHHLAQGAHHLILIFDHLDDPSEAELAAELSRSFGPALTIWDGAEVARSRWPALPSDPRLAGLADLARGGASPQAVCARQTLNASAALVAARAGDFGAPDWLVHLDADELLHCDDRCRDLPLAFAAATAAGWTHLRLLNHELLREPGERKRYKLNPRLAAERLGEQGWAQTMRALRLQQEGRRPWFTGYLNGKGAIAVAHGALAAGVHGFYPDDEQALLPILLAGPCVLHCHNVDAATFRSKAMALTDRDHSQSSLFPLTAVECQALACVKQARAEGADEAELERRLDELHHQLGAFKAEELELLDQLGLLLTP